MPFSSNSKLSSAKSFSLEASKIYSTRKGSDRSLDSCKLQTFVDNNINVAKMMISIIDGIKSIAGKEKLEKKKMLVGNIFSVTHKVLKSLLLINLDKPGNMSFENIVGKGENAGNQHFLLLPQWFLPSQNKF